MKRRDFIKVGTGSVVAWSLTTRAESAGIPLVGVLAAAGSRQQRSFVALLEGLRRLGYVERKNLAIEFRSAERQLERLPALAAELARLDVALIVAYGGPAIEAAMSATKTIPIVMGRMNDADALGVVTNFARPGGNVTGMSFPSAELSTKWLEFLRDLLPPGAKIAALADAAGTSHEEKLSEAAARKVGVDLKVLSVRGPQQIPEALAAAKSAHVQGLIVLASPLMSNEMLRIAKLAREQPLAATYMYREFTEAGGLLSYGPLETDPNFELSHAADFVARILRGAKPGDLPVEQPSRYDLAINLNTAKALGIKIPETLLGRADAVFE